jgi:hypothetical protein
MSENDTLQQAYQLIRSGEKTQAVKLLLPIVRADPDNADAWWLLANAVDKSDQAKRALQQVLKIRPNDQRARRFLEQLGGSPPPIRTPPPTTFDEDAPFTTSGAPAVYRNDSADDDEAPTAERDVWANAFAANDADAPSRPPAQRRAVDPDLNFDEDPFAPDKPTAPLPARKSPPPAGGQRRSPSSRPPARSQQPARAGGARRPGRGQQRRRPARPIALPGVEEFTEDPFAPDSAVLKPRRSVGEQIVTILIAVLLLALIILAVVLTLNNSVGSTS